MSSNGKPTIGYIAQFFPRLTETFVYREVEALRAKGFEVVTFANRTSDLSTLSEESKQFIPTTEYFFPLKALAFVWSIIYFECRHPVRFFGTLWFIMTRPGESADNRRRTLGHFFGGVYLAYRGKQRGIEHIHAHFSVNAATIGLVMSRLLDIPFSFTVHNNIFTDRLILKEKLEAAKFIVSISDYSTNYLLDYDSTVSADKFHKVRCGIPPENFVPQPRPNNEIPRLVSLSSLTERKGTAVLIDACHELEKRGVKFICEIGGEGPERPIIEAKIKEYNLGDHVQLNGIYYQQDIADYLESADVFVLPCITAKNGDIDGIPVVIMEALAKEVPTISTTVSGIPELITDGVEGLLVQEKDPVALADAIERLFADKQFATELGKNGRNKVIDEFNITKTTDNLVTLFEKYVK